jgi:DNA-binding LacI/PurR family transcriptional regulator
MALEEHGRPIPEPMAQGDWSSRSGYESGLAMVRETRPTAVFAANDQMALRLLRALHEAGIRVPEDVSVVGFDDMPESGYFTPPLTTVRQDFRELGQRAPWPWCCASSPGSSRPVCRLSSHCSSSARPPLLPRA